MRKIAIIGGGNMGGAIAKSLCGTDYSLVVTAASQATLDNVKKECPDAEVTTDNAEAVKGASIVVIAVKPYLAQEVIDEMKENLEPGAIVISVIAALPLKKLSNMLDAESKHLSVVRCIPNTAIRNGKSVTFLAFEQEVTPEVREEVDEIFKRSGTVFKIKERDMDACCALASCGIVYFLRFIRAASEGAVVLGLKAKFATQIAAATAEGAASLLEDGSHPEVEIDKVTTPGGLTIRGLNTLEANGFSHAVIEALKASVSTN